MSSLKAPQSKAIRVGHQLRSKYKDQQINEFGMIFVFQVYWVGWSKSVVHQMRLKYMDQKIYESEMIFTELASLGRFSHIFAMSVFLSVCAMGCSL